ncbi:hypothetical protein E4U59_003783 [Claviceps monticola]|nr:hypothetical protein E4U59_003783 [Claviceps monticola]
MSTYTEEDIDEAIELHRTGVSVRRSAESYGIPPSILQDRVRQDEVEQKQKLERLHEAFRNWILILAVLGCPPKYHEATEQATVLAAEIGYDEPIKRKATTKKMCQKGFFELPRTDPSSNDRTLSSGPEVKLDESMTRTNRAGLCIESLDDLAPGTAKVMTLV